MFLAASVTGVSPRRYPVGSPRASFRLQPYMHHGIYATTTVRFYVDNALTAVPCGWKSRDVIPHPPKHRVPPQKLVRPHSFGEGKSTVLCPDIHDIGMDLGELDHQVLQVREARRGGRGGRSTFGACSRSGRHGTPTVCTKASFR